MSTAKDSEIIQRAREENYLVFQEGTDRQSAFHQALIDTGLVKHIKQPSYDPISEQRLIQVEGKPISETIIKERR